MLQTTTFDKITTCHSPDNLRSWRRSALHTLGAYQADKIAAEDLKQHGSTSSRHPLSNF